MNKLIRLVALGAVLAFLFYTNPDKEAFEQYIGERVEQKLSEDTEDLRLGRLLTDLGSSVVGSLAARVSDRKEYFLFSLYQVDLGADGNPDESWRFLGIAGRFIELSNPNAE